MKSLKIHISTAILVIFTIFNSDAQIEQLLNKPLKLKKQKDTKENTQSGEPTAYQKRFAEYEAKCKEPGAGCKKTMYFSNQPITATTLPDQSLIPQFEPSDWIYCRVYFDRPAKEAIGHKMEIKKVNYWGPQELIVDTIYEVSLYSLRLNDVSCSSKFEDGYILEYSSSEFTQNFLDIPIITDPSVSHKHDAWLPWCEGKQTYHLVLGNFQYAGDFTSNSKFGARPIGQTSAKEVFEALEKQEKERIEKLTQEAKARDKANEELAFKAKVEARTVPDYCYNAKGKFSDPQLSLSNIRRMAMKEKAVATILYLSIEEGSGDWEISWKQDVYPQIPVSKHTTRNICLVYKTPEGNCVKTNLTIIKDYINGTYNEPYAHFHFGSGYEFNGKLSCDKVRKPAVK